jgi:ABC-2 type transport system permease protein
MRLLIIKDFRTFRRDPAQWAQVLIFTGLLGLYFGNIRRMFLDDISPLYQNGISLLNLLATALLLCTYTGRFIYPMISLEGRKFWILGLLPLRRERLLWGKFAFAATGGMLIAESLVVLSDLMLGVYWVVLVLHVLAVAILAVGLSGLSVGLSACLPNFRESDPSKIAVGFGGTLNLVAGLLFLGVTVALVAAPWHVYAAIMASREDAVGAPPWWLFIGVVPGLAGGVCAALVPLRAGARTLRRMEF